MTQVAIYDGFLDALARLDRDQRKTLSRFVHQFRRDPAAAVFAFEPVSPFSCLADFHFEPCESLMEASLLGLHYGQLITEFLVRNAKALHVGSMLLAVFSRLLGKSVGARVGPDQCGAQSNEENGKKCAKNAKPPVAVSYGLVDELTSKCGVAPWPRGATFGRATGGLLREDSGVTDDLLECLRGPSAFVYQAKAKGWASLADADDIVPTQDGWRCHWLVIDQNLLVANSLDGPTFLAVLKTGADIGMGLGFVGLKRNFAVFT